MSLHEIVGLTRDFTLIVTLMLALLMTLRIYRKVSTILDSAKSTLREVEELTSYLSNKFVKPAETGSKIVSGAGKIAAFILRLSRKKKKG